MSGKKSDQISFKQFIKKRTVMTGAPTPHPFRYQGLFTIKSNEKKPGWLRFFFGGIILPSYVGTFNKNLYNDPYQTTRIHWLPRIA